MSQIQINISEKYYNMVPRPTIQERRQLKESIILYGQREPIILNQHHTIIDGHTRFEICQDLGLEPKHVIRQFDSEKDEMIYVIDANLSRRQLSNYQKFEMAYDLYLVEKERVRTLPYHHGELCGRVTEIIGRQIGMSYKTFEYCLYIHDKADEKLKRELRNSKITITGAWLKLRKKPNPSKENYLKSESIVECPCCKGHFKRKDLRIIKR